MPSGILNWFLIAIVGAIGFAIGRNISGRLGF